MTKSGSMGNASADSKGATFMILKNHASAPIRKERLRLMPTRKGEGREKKLAEKSGVKGKGQKL